MDDFTVDAECVRDMLESYKKCQKELHDFEEQNQELALEHNILKGNANNSRDALLGVIEDLDISLTSGECCSCGAFHDIEGAAQEAIAYLEKSDQK